MDIKNDTIYQITTKVLLFTKRKYFPLFRNIFIQNTLNYLLSKCEYHFVINSKIKLTTNKDKTSLWGIIAKNFKKEKEIIDFDLNNYRRSHDEENEDEHFLDYLLNQTGTIQVNNIVFSYLNKISNIKLNKLISISIKEKLHLINLMKIYLGLCSQNFNRKLLANKLGRNPDKKYTKKFIKKYSRNEKSVKNSSKTDESKIRKIPLLKLKTDKKSLSREKLNESKSNRKSISINKSLMEEDNEKNNSISAYDDMINEQIQKSINKLNKKNKSLNSKILYSSSFARLFIGETDKESIREKYLSNFEVKKEKKLKKNQNKNLSSIYLKVFLSRFEQNRNNKLPSIEKGIENILVKLKKNEEIIDRYRRLKDKSINNNYFYLGNKINNKKTIKKGQIIYNLNNTNLHSKSDFSVKNKTKYISRYNIPNKLTKTMINKKKLAFINDNKINNSDRIIKNNSLSFNSNKLINISKEKEKLKSIYEYSSNNFNYKSKLKDYLYLNNLNQNNAIKFKEKVKIKSKNKIKNKFFKRAKDDIVIINGNLTTRIQKNNDDQLWKYKIFNQNCSQSNNNNIINYLTKNDLFFENV